jgi:hypothetical protein
MPGKTGKFMLVSVLGIGIGIALCFFMFIERFRSPLISVDIALHRRTRSASVRIGIRETAIHSSLDCRQRMRRLFAIGYRARKSNGKNVWRDERRGASALSTLRQLARSIRRNAIARRCWGPRPG